MAEFKFMRISSGIVKWILLGVVLLWLAGFIHLPILNTPLFDIFGRPFTIHHLLILLLVGYAIRFLPGILQTAVAILLILWLISNFFFLSIGGLANIFFLIIVIAILFAIF
jgi:hypothetical protein